VSLAGSFNGLSFGPGGAVAVGEVTGIDDLPRLRTVDNPRGSDHGNWTTTDRAEGRVITYTWRLVADDPEKFDVLRQQVITAVTVADGEMPLRFDGSTRRVLAKPRRRLIPRRADAQQRTGDAIVEFVASDPRIYAENEMTSSTGFPELTGGWSPPLEPPLSFGSPGVNGRLTVTNDGNFETPWTVTFTGPWQNPTIEHLGLGKILRLVGSVAAGQTLVVSSKFPRSVLLDGADRYPWFAQTPDWFDLAPGPNELRVGGSTGSGTATLTTRSAWM
jgi:hypothetical protein